MSFIEQLSDLACCDTVEDWCSRIFKLGSDLGYEQTLLAIFPDRNVPVEVEYAFLHSNYSAVWRNKYDAEKLGHIDPTLTHCMNKSTPLIWSPDFFPVNGKRKCTRRHRPTASNPASRCRCMAQRANWASCASSATPNLTNAFTTTPGATFHSFHICATSFLNHP
jgi:hypothetical protein